MTHSTTLGSYTDYTKDIAEPQLGDWEWDPNDYQTLELLMVKDGVKPK